MKKLSLKLYCIIKSPSIFNLCEKQHKSQQTISSITNDKKRRKCPIGGLEKFLLLTKIYKNSTIFPDIVSWGRHNPVKKKMSSQKVSQKNVSSYLTSTETLYVMKWLKHNLKRLFKFTFQVSNYVFNIVTFASRVWV